MLRRHRGFILPSGILLIGAAAAVWLQIAWPRAAWASYTRLALFLVCVSALIVLDRLGFPGVPVLRSLSPNRRRITVGALLVLAILPWSLVVGSAARYHLLPNNFIGGLVLLIPLTAFIVIGLYMVISGISGHK